MKSMKRRKLTFLLGITLLILSLVVAGCQPQPAPEATDEGDGADTVETAEPQEPEPEEAEPTEEETSVEEDDDETVIRVSYHDVSNEFAPAIQAGVERAATGAGPGALRLPQRAEQLRRAPHVGEPAGVPDAPGLELLVEDERAGVHVAHRVDEADDPAGAAQVEAGE